MKPKLLLAGEKEGCFIDERWNFRIIDNDIVMQDRLACSLHYHSFFEIEIPYGGTAKHYLNDAVCQASPGEVYLLRYFDVHRYECKSGEGIRIYNLIFNSVALPEDILFMLTKDSQNLVCRFEGEAFESLLRDVRFLLEGQKNENPDAIHIHMMRTMFTKVVLTILSKCLANRQEQEKKTSTVFRVALQQIQCRFREAITLKEIAKEVGVTPNYLGQLFMKHFNVSFSGYLRRIRLEYARNLLSFYDYGIEQVAVLSGFATDSHFISCFKAAYGITPRQYKAAVQNKEAL